MSSPILRVSWYRFRTTFRRSWSAHLGIVVLVGLVGGLALASMAGARRTASSFEVYSASTNPSAIDAVTAVLNPQAGSDVGYNPEVIRAIALLPHVRKVASSPGLNVEFLKSNGAPLTTPAFPASAGTGTGSLGGEYFDVDRVTVVAGRMADPDRVNEFVVSASQLHLLGLHIGEIVPLGAYTNAQTALPGFGTASVRPYRTLHVKLVGTVVFSSTVVEDDVDATTQPTLLFTPALTRQLLGCCVNYTGTAVQVAGGSRFIGAVESEVDPVLPKGFPASYSLSASTALKADRAIEPVSIALWAFGGIAMVAALLIAAQLIGRQLRSDATGIATMRALGASPAMTGADQSIGVFGAIIMGSLLAVGVAVALSPLAPLGPVRPVYPSRGFAADWTVLGFGWAVFALCLSAVAVVVAYRQLPHRLAARPDTAEQTSSTVSRLGATLGLPEPALVGIRFALQPGAGTNAVPVRSAILGSTLAMIVVVATVTFGASLAALVSHPSLYGWNWSYELNGGGGSGDIPAKQATAMLRHDGSVAQWSGAYFDTMRLDGSSIPVLGQQPGAAVQPPVLSGHGLDGPGQVVLGQVTLATLHKEVGGTVVLRGGVRSPMRLRIVGTATMPAIGEGGIQHLEMGTGALVSSSVIPAADRNPFDNPVPGPEVIFVRLKQGVNHAAALRSLRQIAAGTSTAANFGVTVISVQRPAEIVNFRTMGTIPTYLAGGLTLGVIAALGLTLMASVRRRSREMALFKAIGVTKRQLASMVAWQSSTTVAIGTIIGIPLGIVAGRVLWDLFAGAIDAVPAPSVPALSVVLVALGALVLANVVAAVPGRIAARTPTALLLRSE